MISANATDLMRQAPMTVVTYLNHIVDTLDDKFGKGYAKNNPLLVGMLVQSCAQDFHTAISAKALTEALPDMQAAVKELSGIKRAVSML